MGDWLIHHEIERQARWRPDHTAVWFEEEALTYAEFDARINRVARALRDAGVTPGEMVVVHGNNHVDLFVLYLACSKLGAVFSPISTYQSEVNIEYICDTVSPAFVCYTPADDIVSDTLPLVERYTEDTRFVSLDPDTPRDDGTLDELSQGYDGTKPAWADDQDDGADHNIFWTSGTTGRPKAVVRNHRSSIHFADPLQEALPFTENTRRTLHNNMMFVAPYLQTGLPTLMGGGSLYVLRQFTPERFYDVYATKDINVSLILFSQIRRLLAYLDDIDESLTLEYLHGSIRDVEGGNLRTEIADRIIHIYAATETGVPMALPVEGPFDERPQVGKPGRSVDVRVVPPDVSGIPDEPPKPGDQGEIALRGDVTMTRYLQAEPQRENVQDGWVFPGDIVRVNDDRDIVFVSRADNRLRSGGINVYPETVETVLENHAAVEKAVVVGVDDEMWGDKLCSLVVSKTETPDALAGELNALCQQSEELTRELRPKEYAIVPSTDDVPERALGKIDRDAIGDRYFAEQPR